MKEFLSLYDWLKDSPKENFPALQRGEVPAVLEPKLKMMLEFYGVNASALSDGVLYFYETIFETIPKKETYSQWHTPQYILKASNLWYPNRDKLSPGAWYESFRYFNSLSADILFLMTADLPDWGTLNKMLSVQRKKVLSPTGIAKIWESCILKIPVDKNPDHIAALFRSFTRRFFDEVLYSGKVASVHDTLRQVLSLNNYQNLENIDSMRELRRVHEHLAERRRLEKIEQDAAYAEIRTWPTAFCQAVMSNGWRIPVSAEELDIRGRDHHNCVGSYSRIFNKDTKGNLSRLVIDDNREAEFRIFVQDAKIEEVEIIQCKTAYNRDADRAGLSAIKEWLETRATIEDIICK